MLAASFTVVCPDLRGYGESSKPATTPDHEPYSKRAMARDCVALMRALGHDRFAVAGHDRGSYVALRTALDHPDAVTALAVLDSVPIGEALARADARFAAAWWHWFFLGQTDKPAERVICADPDAWYTATAEHMGEEAFADFRARDPRPGHGARHVRGLPRRARHRPGARRGRPRGRPAGRCPTLVAWSLHDDLEDLYGDPLAIWRDWADDVRGATIDSGHHMAEEAPDQLAAVLGEFFSVALRAQEPRQLRQLEQLRALRLEVLARRAVVVLVVAMARDAAEPVGVVADVNGRRSCLRRFMPCSSVSRADCDPTSAAARPPAPPPARAR